jgi:hypothetical protein
MRFLPSAIATAVVTTSAAAEPLVRLDDRLVAPECRHYENHGDIVSTRSLIEARISMASCTADVRLRGVPVEAYNDAVAPALTLLDQAVAADDPALAIVALAIKADLYSGLAVRARNSVPMIDALTVGVALANHDRRHAEIEATVQPWLDRARAAQQAAVAIGRRHPDAMHHPIAASAFRASEQALTATQSASR